jgi:hypothetical protein
MAMRMGRGLLVVAVLVVAACSGSGFKSTTYGYSLTVPSEWITFQASKAWDGTQAISNDAPESDQFISRLAARAWAVAAPTDNDLAAYTTQLVESNARDHGDTCPPQPEAQESIKVGNEPGTLLAYNCGILINLAVAVHNGRAYVFGFRDLAVQAATDAADRSTFVAMLESVRFPD